MVDTIGFINIFFGILSFVVKIKFLIPFGLGWQNIVVLHNPELKDDGYVFDDQKIYLLPELCP